MTIQRTTALLGLLVLIGAQGCGQAGPEPAPTQQEAAAPVDASEITPITIDGAESDDIPDVVAKVGDDTITAEAFRKALGRFRMARGGFGAGGPMTKPQQREVLDNLIDTKILTQLAKNAGVAAADEEVDGILDQQKERLGSPDAFAAGLAQLGVTEEELREDIRQSLTQRAYMEKVTQDLDVTEEELTKNYEELKAEGRLDRPEETVDVSHILVRVQGTDEQAWAAGKEKIDAARLRVTNGEDFADVAKEVSEDPGSAPRGGSYPDTPRGKMVPEFEERMFSLPIGAVSEPFRTDFGWHILTVTAKHPPGTMAIDEVEEPLKQYVLNKKRQDVIQNLITEAKADLDIQTFYLADVSADEEAATSPSESESQATTPSE